MNTLIPFRGRIISGNFFGCKPADQKKGCCLDQAAGLRIRQERIVPAAIITSVTIRTRW